MAFVTPTDVATGEVLTASRYNADVVANTIAGHPLVSTLPGSPADGDTIYFQTTAMAALSVAWTLRYRSGGGTHKWEFVGGSPMENGDAGSTQEQFSNTAYVTTTNAPKITAPVAGLYLICYGSEIGYVSGGPGVGSSIVTVKIGAAAASDDNASVMWGSQANTLVQVGRTIKRTLAASDEVKQFYKGPAGTTVGVLRRSVSIVPVAVG